MTIETSYLLLLAFATVLAPMAQGQAAPPQPQDYRRSHDSFAKTGGYG